MTKLFLIAEGPFCSFTISEEGARKDAARGARVFVFEAEDLPPQVEEPKVGRWVVVDRDGDALSNMMFSPTGCRGDNPVSFGSEVRARKLKKLLEEGGMTGLSIKKI